MPTPSLAYRKVGLAAVRRRARHAATVLRRMQKWQWEEESSVLGFVLKISAAQVRRTYVWQNMPKCRRSPIGCCVALGTRVGEDPLPDDDKCVFCKKFAWTT